MDEIFLPADVMPADDKSPVANSITDNQIRAWLTALRAERGHDRHRRRCLPFGRNGPRRRRGNHSAKCPPKSSARRRSIAAAEAGRGSTGRRQRRRRSKLSDSARPLRSWSPFMPPRPPSRPSSESCPPGRRRQALWPADVHDQQGAQRIAPAIDLYRADPARARRIRRQRPLVSHAAGRRAGQEQSDLQRQSRLPSGREFCCPAIEIRTGISTPANWPA